MSSSTTQRATGGTTVVDRRPLVGTAAGLCLGLAAALLLFVYGVLPMTIAWLVVLLLIGGVAGVITALVLPPLHPASRGASSGPGGRSGAPAQQ